MSRHFLLLTVGAAVLALLTSRAPGAQSTHPDALSHAGLPSVLPGVDTSTSPQGADVTVATPSPPTEQELAGDSVYQFIAHHATTHYVTVSTARKFARWRGGKQSICPITAGLTPGDNAFVTARVRALATYVGAPVEQSPQCKNNVQLLFTSNPQEGMDAVTRWATGTTTFGIRYAGGKRDLLAYRSEHAIQGWYITTGGGARVLNTDMALVGLDVLPIWPQVIQNYSGVDSPGHVWGAAAGAESASGWSS